MFATLQGESKVVLYLTKHHGPKTCVVLNYGDWKINTEQSFGRAFTLSETFVVKQYTRLRVRNVTF
jgi:hypothetical protein